jgi:hypothetical protein
LDAAVNGFTAFDDTAAGRAAVDRTAVDPKTPPKSISIVFVKTLEAERKLMEKHLIESQQIESRPFA